MPSKKIYLASYKKLIKLYPKSYRNEYENEMIQTMKVMFEETNSFSDETSLILCAAKDYLSSLVKLNLLALESAVSESPNYVVSSSKFSTFMLAPFFIICGYNSYNQYILHRTVPIMSIESRTWIIYCIILPIIAGLIIFQASIRRLVEILRYRHNSDIEWLLLGTPIILIVTIMML